MTTLDRPDSTTVLPEETAALIEVFVAGFQSAKTRCNYRANLRAWFGWAHAGGVDGLAAQRADVEAYVRHLEQCGYAPNTICQRVATLSSFYGWAVGEGHVAGNPVAGARRPRKPTESTASGLSRHELTDFLDAAEARGGDVYACACLLALNGLRVGELCAANVEDLGESTWHHTLTLRAPTTKGHKPAVIALAPRTVQAIGLSLGQRRSGPLLCNTRGRRMTSYNVAYLVTALRRQIGVERRITPHSLRHSAITIALDAGIGLRDVQDFARHEDPKTTAATTGRAASSTGTPPMRSPSTSPAAADHLASPSLAAEDPGTTVVPRTRPGCPRSGAGRRAARGRPPGGPGS